MRATNKAVAAQRMENQNTCFVLRPQPNLLVFTAVLICAETREKLNINLTKHFYRSSPRCRLPSRLRKTRRA